MNPVTSDPKFRPKRELDYGDFQVVRNALSAWSVVAEQVILSNDPDADDFKRIEAAEQARRAGQLVHEIDDYLLEPGTLAWLEAKGRGEDV